MKTIFIFYTDGEQEILYIKDQGDDLQILDKYLFVRNTDGKVYMINHKEISSIRIEDYME